MDLSKQLDKFKDSLSLEMGPGTSTDKFFDQSKFNLWEFYIWLKKQSETEHK